MGHSHGGGGDDGDLGGPLTRWLRVIMGLLAAATVLGLLVLWPSQQSFSSEIFGGVSDLYDGVIEGVDAVPCAGTTVEDQNPCLAVDVRLRAGPERGEVISLELPDIASTPDYSTGDGVVVGRTEAPPELAGEAPSYYIADFQRDRPLLLLVALFAVAVVALGMWQGVRALAGLGLSLLLLSIFMVPAILDGQSPVPVAVVGSAAIMLSTLYLIHGLSVRTSVAVLGTLGSLTLVVTLAVLFVAVGHFTGLASEEALTLQVAAEGINLRGLLLAGIVIGTLGVLDDVTVTQVSAVWELHAANPLASAGSLYRSGLRIGRDHIASTVNTLVLAYAGASLPLLSLIAISNRSAAEVATGELIATEIVRTLVGSIGLVASVPLTTILAALIVTRGADAGGEPEPAPSLERPAVAQAVEPAASDPALPRERRSFRRPRREQEWRGDDG